jgi:hypothetical protein
MDPFRLPVVPDVGSPQAGYVWAGANGENDQRLTLLRLGKSLYDVPMGSNRFFVGWPRISKSSRV